MGEENNNYKLNKPVLLLTWNRLDYLKKVFEKVKSAKPPRLYIASDGPRENNPDDVQKINEVRKYILDNIDWNTEVKTRFLDKNSGGCGPGVSGAINWFFENEEDGIILEDDCVPSISFFRYCEELLDKYKNDKRIWQISGFAPVEADIKETYYFSRIQHCWGWASWKDRWAKFKFDITDYDEKNLKKFSKNKDVQIYWGNILRQVKNNEIDTWAYRWMFEIVAEDGFCILPAKSLISNIGADGVHYLSETVPARIIKAVDINEIIHPEKMEFNTELTEKMYLKHCNAYKKLSLIENIFSIRNKINELGIKQKVITIFGFKIEV